MSRRIPLWATLLPLLIGVIAWAWFWHGFAEGFRRDLEKALPDDVRIDVGGFPYRLEARFPDFEAKLADAALSGSVKAAELRVNRVPWQADRQVIGLKDSQVRVALSTLLGAEAEVTAAEAQASLTLKDGHIGRLSMVWEAPRIVTGLLPVGVEAGHLEVHLRETPAKAEGGALPTEAQLVISGEKVRFGEGQPLGVELQAELSAAAAIRSYAGWAASGGAVALRSVTLADETGEVARMTATLKPDGAGALWLEGQVETVCPANVRAAIAGAPPVSEKRSRKPEAIAVSGRFPGGLVAAPRDAAKPAPPVRGQEPACPRLR
ncbi:DUF2125 domain-containing protein [Sandaracinobacter sp. RS1-74]|uniref:DUF2125 domain-containing protein n=1 Tax=Sandaracinobacteroides sayramensis TaxID=2913411 RepID=UPI001EDB85E5|nr:DUF2125 domain-containing protein [Sandaracinobacteroides sayramensis]MCG2841668.1 DUF2125 domain-containing protein [Sandaracinobacteroides sayramensis]